jgi:hypothetical protein
MQRPVEIMAAAFQDELQKIAASKAGIAGLAEGAVGKALLPAAVGIAGYETLRRANQDRKMGRAMRVQQQY